MHVLDAFSRPDVRSWHTTAPVVPVDAPAASAPPRVAQRDRTQDCAPTREAQARTRRKGRRDPRERAEARSPSRGCRNRCDTALPASVSAHALHSPSANGILRRLASLHKVAPGDVALPCGPAIMATALNLTHAAPASSASRSSSYPMRSAAASVDPADPQVEEPPKSFLDVSLYHGGNAPSSRRRQERLGDRTRPARSRVASRRAARMTPAGSCSRFTGAPAPAPPRRPAPRSPARSPRSCRSASRSRVLRWRSARLCPAICATSRR